MQHVTKNTRKSYSCHERAQPKNSRSESTWSISSGAVRCATGDFCCRWRCRRSRSCGWRGTPSARPPRVFGRQPVVFARGADEAVRRLPRHAGWIFQRESRRPEMSGLPRRSDSSRGAGVHAVLRVLPRGSSGSDSPRGHQRRELHAVPCELDQRATARRISRAISTASRAIIRNLPCFAPGAAIREQFSSIIIATCSRICSGPMAATCRWFAPTVTARRPMRMDRGLTAIRRVNPEWQKPRRQMRQSPMRSFLLPSRAYMAPATYARTCAACHSLQFDKRLPDSVPHDTPEVIHPFIVAKLQAYIAAHPADLRVPRDPSRDLPEKAIPADYRLLTPQQWVGERTAEAEQLLWRKTCKQCHTLVFSEGAALPKIAPSNITSRYMPHAQFDHSQHGLVDCTSCHTAAHDQPAKLGCAPARHRHVPLLPPFRQPKPPNRAALSATHITIPRSASRRTVIFRLRKS